MSTASDMAVLGLQEKLKNACADEGLNPSWSDVQKVTLERAEEVIELISIDYFYEVPKITINEFGSVCFIWLNFSKDLEVKLIVSPENYIFSVENYYKKIVKEVEFTEKEKIHKYLPLLDY